MENIRGISTIIFFLHNLWFHINQKVACCHDGAGFPQYVDLDVRFSGAYDNFSSISQDFLWIYGDSFKYVFY